MPSVQGEDGPQEEEGGLNASEIVSAYVVAKHVNDLLKEIQDAKEVRKGYTAEQIELINACADIPLLDRFTMVQAFSRLSEQGLEHIEERLLVVKRFAEKDTEGLFDFQTVRVMTMFMMILQSLKPRSKRHLENFLAAVTDGDWMDGLICVSPQGIEFRFVDKASEDTRKEFGV